MKRRIFAVILTGVMLVAGCSGCTKHASKKEPASSVVDVAPTENEKYALILESSESSYEKSIVEGFTQAMQDTGKQYVIETPKDNNPVQDQEQFVEDLIKEKVSAIAIAPSDADALKDSLKAALDAGIDVCSYDTPATPDSRELFINQTGTEQISMTLMDAVLDLSSGTGQWAILSSSSTSTKQNEWIDAMRKTMKDDKYSNLEMVEVAYSDDQYQKAYDQTKSLLLSYPDLKVICVPSTKALPAAAQAVKDSGSGVKVTGFGLPSEMTDYVGSSKCVPYFYLWNPVDLGKLTGYVSVALHSGKITGKLGEKFKAGSMGNFEVTKSADSGTEVIVGSPYKFDQSNIEEWKDVF